MCFLSIKQRTKTRGGSFTNVEKTVIELGSLFDKYTYRQKNKYIIFTCTRVRIGKYVRLGRRNCPTKHDQRVVRHPCINNITISVSLSVQSCYVFQFIWTYCDDILNYIGIQVQSGKVSVRPECYEINVVNTF